MTQSQVPAQQAPGTCSQCLFWEPPEITIEGAFGRCHFNAPQPPGQVSAQVVWPKTAHNDWCGQFAAAPTGGV